MQVSKLHSDYTFHLQPFWLQTLDAIDSESCQKSFPSLAHSGTGN